MDSLAISVEPQLTDAHSFHKLQFFLLRNISLFLTVTLIRQVKVPDFVQMYFSSFKRSPCHKGSFLFLVHNIFVESFIFCILSSNRNGDKKAYHSYSRNFCQQSLTFLFIAFFLPHFPAKTSSVRLDLDSHTSLISPLFVTRTLATDSSEV